MTVLALDLATRTGFAHGALGEPPKWGSHDFGRGRSNGEVLANFHGWLNGKIDAVGATMVVFESPYMPSGQNPWAAPANALTIRRLFAFAGITEAVCHTRRLRCLEARPSEITRGILGGPAPRRRAEKKAATIKMIRLLGFPVENDDEADALALWLYAEANFAPHQVSRRRSAAGLELDLSPRTRNAPRGVTARRSETATITDGNQDGITNKQDISATRQLQLARS